MDEIVSLVPNNSARGWTLAVEDPVAGIRLLQRLRATGHGGARLFAGLARYTAKASWGGAHCGQPARRRQGDGRHSRGRPSHRSRAGHVGGATGVRDNEVVRADAVRAQLGRTDLRRARNGERRGAPSRRVRGTAAARPTVEGRYVLATYIEQQFARQGVRVRWIEDWHMPTSWRAKCTARRTSSRTPAQRRRGGARADDYDSSTIGV